MARQQFETRRPPTKMMGSEGDRVKRPSTPPPANVEYNEEGIPFIRSKRFPYHNIPLGLGCFHYGTWEGVCSHNSCSTNEWAMVQFMGAKGSSQEQADGPA